MEKFISQKSYHSMFYFKIKIIIYAVNKYLYIYINNVFKTQTKSFCIRIK